MFKVRNLGEMLRSNRGSVEETDAELIYEQVLEDERAEKEGREPKNLMSKPKEEDKELEETEDTNQPDIDVVDKPEESEETDEQTGEEDSKPEEEETEDSETEETVNQDSVIMEHAEKYGMSYAEAKEDIEKTEKIIEQFKNDPKEMARALRNKDREYDKLKNGIEKQKQEQAPIFQKMTVQEFKNTAYDNIMKDKEKWIEGFKEEFPSTSEMMTEEAIIEQIIDKNWNKYQEYAEGKEKEVKKIASKVRDEIISSVSKEDIKFLPDVKVYLEQLNDRTLLQKDFDRSMLLKLAKGNKYDEDIKKIEADAFKRGQENAKILGEKTKVSGTQPKVKSKTTLNEDQKERAEDMFTEADGYTKERAYEMFIDTFKDELKENPNYI